MPIIEHISLKALNTFGIDVSARMYTRISCMEDLEELFSRDILLDYPHLILGGGSNVLFTDDYDGMVIHICNKGIEVLDVQDVNPPLPASEMANDRVFVKVEAGENWDDFVAYCVGQDWGGLENLSLIPGQVGTSPLQNIGAYGAELKDHLYSLEAFEKHSGKSRVFDKSSCKFAYRDSYFKQEGKNRFVIMNVTFSLSRNKHRLRLGYGSLAQQLDQSGISDPGLSDIRNAVAHIRRSKLPDPVQLGNAGSFFKNPVIPYAQFAGLKKDHPDLVAYEDEEGMKIAAGWLIEKAGWKAYRKGDAGVHEKQALVLVNYGTASGKDILSLAEKIRESIMQEFHIALEPEVNII